MRPGTADQSRWPSVRQASACIGALTVWLAVTALFIGLRPEHVFMALVIAVLFFITGSTRRLIVALIPFALFGISYDWMNLCPNYMVNPIDISGLYHAEKSIFGITVAEGVTLTPNEYFAQHTTPVMDFMAGLFYLCWVPVPIIFGLWMYLRGYERNYVHFALVFLFVNLLGFTFYYVHPAAPPWYVAMHGMEPIFGTPGNVAGLAAFDRMTGLSIFDALYGRNSNVFAAMPSLHSAYTLVACIYAMRLPHTASSRTAWVVALAIITLGIWFTAVYTSHHYLLDVAGGIACGLAGAAIFELLLMRIPGFARFVDNYALCLCNKTYGRPSCP